MAETKSLSPSGVLRFGVFQVNLAARELSKHGVRVRLPGQPFCILSMLLEKPGEIVTREEMQQRLWASDTFVDFEHSLNSAIKKLRAAVGDSPENSRYIETVPRLGYRFIAPLEQVSVPAPAEGAGAGHEPGRPAPKRTRWAVPAGLAAIVIVGLAAYWQWGRIKAARLRESERRMLAVLPFENLTGDPNQDYLTDGLTEEMIAQLGRLDPKHLGVIARTSVMHYKHSQDSLQQIGRDLGVQYVLEGSFRHDAGQVRISAQLIQLKDQTHLWSRQYDRELSRLLPLQGEIAQEIADEIQLTLGSPKPGVPRASAATSHTSYEAYDLYLKGRYFWNKRTGDGFPQAADYFQRAVALDANYARAYAGLADTFALMSTWSLVPAREFMPKARTAALKALQIDESLAEAHASLAVIAEMYDYDWQTAEKEFRRAVQLDPDYATGHQWYAECLGLEGRFEEALEESERARQLDPLSLIIGTDHGALLYYSRQYDRAIEQFRNVLEMNADFSRGQDLLIRVYLEKGSVAEATATVERFGSRRESAWYWSAMASVYGRSGRQGEARHAFAKLKEELRKRNYSDAGALLLWADLDLGQKGEAIALLQKCYAEHTNCLAGLKADPIYNPLRSDPRFQDLLRRAGLADSAMTGKAPPSN